MIPKRIARSGLLFFGVCLLTATLSGCGMSEEDKDYYLRGWVRPTDLDKPSPSELRRHTEAFSDPISSPSGPAAAVGSSVGPGSY